MLTSQKCHTKEFKRTYPSSRWRELKNQTAFQFGTRFRLHPGVFFFFLLEVSLSSPYLSLIIPSHLEFLSLDSENLTGIVHMSFSQSNWLHAICTKTLQ